MLRWIYDTYWEVDRHFQMCTTNSQRFQFIFEDNTMDWQKGDYLYTIKAMPPRYIKKENRDKAIKAMMTTRKNNMHT